MTAKLEKIHEMYKLLNEKERVNHDILYTFHLAVLACPRRCDGWDWRNSRAFQPSN